MFAYIVRRTLYALPILIGVNLITFVLFFVVNTPEDMARMHLGTKRVTTEAIDKWKAERGYDRPLLFNGQAEGAAQLTDTIFFDKSVKLFAFDFGSSDSGRDIGADIMLLIGSVVFNSDPGNCFSLFYYSDHLGVRFNDCTVMFGRGKKGKNHSQGVHGGIGYLNRHFQVGI